MFVEEALVGILNAVHSAKSKSNIPIAPGNVEGVMKTEQILSSFR